MNWIKVLGIFLILILILNVIFIAMGTISWLFFWIIITISSIFAYWVIPWIRKS